MSGFDGKLLLEYLAGKLRLRTETKLIPSDYCEVNVPAKNHSVVHLEILMPYPTGDSRWESISVTDVPGTDDPLETVVEMVKQRGDHGLS